MQVGRERGGFFYSVARIHRAGNRRRYQNLSPGIVDFGPNAAVGFLPCSRAQSRQIQARLTRVPAVASSVVSAQTMRAKILIQYILDLYKFGTSENLASSIERIRAINYVLNLVLEKTGLESREAYLADLKIFSEDGTDGLRALQKRFNQLSQNVSGFMYQMSRAKPHPIFRKANLRESLAFILANFNPNIPVRGSTVISPDKRFRTIAERESALGSIRAFCLDYLADKVPKLLAVGH